MTFKCNICGRRIFSAQYTRCFGKCKKFICNNCHVEHKCIDCYVEIHGDYFINEFLFDNPQPIKN